ncbi:hypothetical protein SERLA73DRAFT_178488 [Serpula lacrymans var. lacrymans S7.3]|uniref:Mitochondrial import inner membrane translocase subunit TIM50 n=2 Tax=Serpula lacrymans var. lacrymans TaxID=341189 RepID=F8PRR0_SERL3|nr:uncharacterized protein SERLADRAFT_462961 [Serpula lacrymans var. lacrymans S7.9]EGO00630.1 hypothetical protein SERLA73DRAFT_178488 [Serpula lacrymans var. lacrymans S7.3]EGO26184.1 hypothetical protein SERLADRAFT_462961 [Serpula lacrymans var. lacrymans S7.9]
MYTSMLLRGAPRRAFAPTLRYMASSPSSQPPPTSPNSKSKPPLPPGPTSTLPSASTSVLPSLDFQPAEPGADEGRTGAKSSKDSLSSIERKRRFMGRLTAGMILIGFGVQAAYMGRDWSEEEMQTRKVKIEDAPSTRWTRTKTRFVEIFDYFNKPIWTELLPPPLPAPHQKPYTLLLSMDDLLITSTWDRQHGWRTAKRPGVDYFLAYLSQFYEVVIFTTQHHYTALPIIEKLDPYNFFINYKLFREATRSVNGKIVKDLSYLNRDLSKVILLDTHEEHVSSHPENAIILPKWIGDHRDRGLVAMIPFLESIGIYKPQDVRPILEAYHGKDIPIEYAKKEVEAKQKHIDEWKGRATGLSSGGFRLSALLGGGSDGASSSPIPPTYLEQKRKEAQALYREEQAYIEKNKGEFERLLELDREAMAKEMSGSLWTMIDSMAGNKPEGGATTVAAPTGYTATEQPKAASA